MTDRTITDIADIRGYIFGCGKQAVFTIEFARTGVRFTYRARRERSKFFFADVLTGPENEFDYSFIGTLARDRLAAEWLPRMRWAFHYSPKSTFDDQHPAVVAIDWFSERINYRKPLDPQKIRFYHSGRCSHCGRFLTTPESLQRGMGPKCAEKAQGGF